MGQKILGQKQPRLLKACEGSQGFLMLQQGPRDPGRLRGWGVARGSEGVRGAREARPLSLTEDPRLSKASKGFLRPRKVPWPQRGPGRLRGWKGAREARPLSLTEDPRLPKAPEGLRRLRRLSEAPGKSQGSRETQGGSGGEREQGEMRGSKGSKASESDWRPKAAEGFQRLPRLPEAPGSS